MIPYKYRHSPLLTFSFPIGAPRFLGLRNVLASCPLPPSLPPRCAITAEPHPHGGVLRAVVRALQEARPGVREGCGGPRQVRPQDREGASCCGLQTNARSARRDLDTLLCGTGFSSRLTRGEHVLFHSTEEPNCSPLALCEIPKYNCATSGPGVRV